MTYLSREAFKEEVFRRDGGRCVMCGDAAQDAHHILERRLWDESGGYFPENGASLCGSCHIKAEQTLITCEELRERCGIKKIILPHQLYDDAALKYDKWGNIIQPNGQRLPGELFFDESVQKILKAGGALSSFSPYIKYPRTFHLPWSEHVSKDDRVITSLKALEGEEVIVTLKMDGENTTMYSDYMHARSLTAHSHPSRNMVKVLHSKIAQDIPPGWRVCGENLYAKHSIHYKNLEAHFQVFSVWNERNVCLSWDETMEWASMLELAVVPMLYRGPWDEKKIRACFAPLISGDEAEGYVVRAARSFRYAEFRRTVAKFVRKDHVQTHSHWMRNRLEVNGLKKP
jgi:hypothetical protein